jgi:uncharacterized protein
LRRLALLLTTALALVFALAAPAFGHVTVTAPGATRGGSDQEITFRVPVEKKVNTVGLTVALPTSTPIASVLVEPIAGWTHSETTARLAKPIVTDDGDITSAVSVISWKATGRGLAPGEFGAFTIIAGQLPDVPSLTFRALQRYADGSVVAWNQVAAPGSSAEPANPAPVLTLGAKALGDGQRSLEHGTAPLSFTTKSASNTGPVVLSIVALVVAAGALGLAFVTRARSRP